MALNILEQKSNIANALPSGLATSLGPQSVLDSLGDTIRAGGHAIGAAGRTAASTAGTYASEPARHRGRSWRWIAVQLASAGRSMMVGDVDVGTGFIAITEGLSRALHSVTDEATAQAALPTLSALTADLDALTPIVGRLPACRKPVFADMASEEIAGLHTEVERVSSLSTVPDTVKRRVSMLDTRLEGLIA